MDWPLSMPLFTVVDKIVSFLQMPRRRVRVFCSLCFVLNCKTNLHFIFEFNVLTFIQVINHFKRDYFQVSLT